jgi:outer membrane protein OmpA-like peptidoglycan-associated protein
MGNLNFIWVFWTVFAVVAGLPLFAETAELRAGWYSYRDSGPAEYQMLDGQHLICESCPSVPAFRKENKALLGGHEMPKSPALSTVTGMYELAKSTAPIVSHSQYEPLETIYFGLDSYTLSASEIAKLDRAAEKIRSSSTKVEGHACRLGTDSHNNQLSLRRARVVAVYLKAHGIRVDDIEAHGSKEPVGGELKLNRRAVILIKEANIAK